MKASGALLVPATGLIYYSEVAAALARDIEEAGGELIYSFDVASVESTTRPTVSASDGRVIVAASAVNCAGLHSNQLTRLAGANPGIQDRPVSRHPLPTRDTRTR